MNQHAGPASAMSVLIIGLFAILLDDRPPQPPATKPSLTSTVSQPRTTEPGKAVDPPSSIPKPGNEIATTVKQASQPDPTPPKAERIEMPTPSIPALEKETTRAIREPAPGPKPAPSPDSTVPRAPFTVVKAGEKLADVASRVYGTAAAAESLWRANRDQVASLDARLAAGTLLRTP